MYAVSLWREVSEVEGCEGASVGPSSYHYHCLLVYLVEEWQRSSHCLDLVSFDFPGYSCSSVGHEKPQNSADHLETVAAPSSFPVLMTLISTWHFTYQRKLQVNPLPVEKLTTETPSKNHHKRVTHSQKNVSFCPSNYFSSSSSEFDSEASDEYFIAWVCFCS